MTHLKKIKLINVLNLEYFQTVDSKEIGFSKRTHFHALVKVNWHTTVMSNFFPPHG